MWYRILTLQPYSAVIMSFEVDNCLIFQEKLLKLPFFQLFMLSYHIYVVTTNRLNFSGLVCLSMVSSSMLASSPSDSTPVGLLQV